MVMVDALGEESRIERGGKRKPLTRDSRETNP